MEMNLQEFTTEQVGDALLILGDCLDVMPRLDAVDMVMSDLPYGTTRNKWDSIVPLVPLWAEYGRLCAAPISTHVDVDVWVTFELA